MPPSRRPANSRRSRHDRDRIMTDVAVLIVAPELLLAAGALVLLLLGAFGGERMTPVINALAVILIAACAIGLVFWPQEGATFNNAFVVDPFARLLKILVLIGSGVALVMSIGFNRAEKFE